MTSTRGLCPTCREYRNAQVLAENESITNPTSYSPIAKGHAYRILECDGPSKTVYFEHESVEITHTHDFYITDDDEDDETPPIANDLTELRDLANDHSGEYSYHRGNRALAKTSSHQARVVERHFG